MNLYHVRRLHYLNSNWIAFACSSPEVCIFLYVSKYKYIKEKINEMKWNEKKIILGVFVLQTYLIGML